MGLYLEDELIAEGAGSSKQAAEQNAAREGLIAKKNGLKRANSNKMNKPTIV